jgi:hypothetical protein
MAYTHQFSLKFNNETFKRLFDSSRRVIDPDADTLNETFFLGAKGYDAKFNHMKNSITGFLGEKGGCNFVICKDDYPVMIYTGRRVDDHVCCFITLQGPDLTGSLSWTQESGAYEAVRDYYANENPEGLRGIIVHHMHEGSFYRLMKANFDRYFGIKGRPHTPLTSRTEYYLNENKQPVAFEYKYMETRWTFR